MESSASRSAGLGFCTVRKYTMQETYHCSTSEGWDGWCRMCVKIHQEYPVHSQSDIEHVALLRWGIRPVGEQLVFTDERLHTLWMLEFGG